MKNKNEIISSYVTNRYLEEKRTVESFIKDIYDEIIKNDKTIKDEEASLRIINKKKDENGYIKVSKKKGTYHFFIYINVHNFLTSKESVTMRLFHIYVTILHEFEHIKLIKDKQYFEYLQLIAGIETMRELKENHIISFVKTMFTHGSYKDQVKRYMSLSSEIWCINKSLEKSFVDMMDFLSLDEKVIVFNMCKGIEIISRNLEIGYYPNGLPYNKFIDYVKAVDKFMKRDSDFIQNNTFLDILFTNEGLKGIKKIYLEKEDTVLYDEIILRYFLYIEQNYKEIFNNNLEMKAYMEKLLNEYCDRVTNYFKNREFCKIFLDTDILEDNEKVLLKNVKRAILCMKDCGMERKGGGIIAE